MSAQTNGPAERMTLEPPGSRGTPLRWVPGACAALAFAALVGAWTAAAVMRPGYSSVFESISELAALGTPSRPTMTGGLVIAGVAMVACVVSARTITPSGRAALAASAVGVLVVAAAPLPVGGSLHTVGALVALGGLAVWPALDLQGGGARLGGPRAARAATALASPGVLALFLIPWAVPYGLVERAVAAGELAWLVAVLVSGARRDDRAAAAPAR